MKLTLKIIGWIVLAQIAGTVLTMLVQQINLQMFPFPEGMNQEDPKAMAQWIAGLPVTAMLMVELSYIVGSLGSGFMVGRFSPAYTASAWVVGVLWTLANIMNVMAIPHPTWMLVLTMVTFIPMVWVGTKLGLKVRPRDA